MKTNFENEFYDQTINELLTLTIKQWRKILLISMILAVSLGLLKFIPLYSMTNNDSLRATQATQKELLQQSVDITQANIKIKEKELDESIYYNLEPSLISRGFISYYIDTPIKDADLGYQKNLVNSYVAYFISGEIYNQIANQLNKYIKPDYLSQIVRVETSGLSSFDVYVLGANEKQTSEIMQLLEQEINNKKPEVSSIVTEHTISLVSESIIITSDTKVLDDQEFQKTRIEALENKLIDEKAQLQIIQSESITIGNALLSGLKFGLIGLIAGIVLSLMFFFVITILSNKIKSKNQIIYNCGVEFLGEFAQENKKCNKLDMFIGKFLGEPHDVPQEEINRRIATNIIAMSSTKKILIAGCKDIWNVEKIAEGISSCDIVKDYEVSFSAKPINSSETLSKMLNYDSIIIIVKKNRTSLDELQNAIYTVDKYKKDFVGVILA